MEKLKRDEATFPTPIFVGSGTVADQAADFLLTALEWVLREDDLSLLYPVEGEISKWTEQLWEKPYQLGNPNPTVATNTTVERDLLRESLALLADPRNEEEKQIAGLLGGISLEEVQRFATALHSNDAAGLEVARSAIVERLGKEIKQGLTPSRVSAFASMVGRCRASRAVALCSVLHKTDARVLINRARQGDMQAVMDLVRVDKLTAVRRK